MPRHPSSLDLPRIGAAGTPRVLRLRADQGADSMFTEAQVGEAARLAVPSRAAVKAGDPVRVEFSFGPMVDEIELPGEVVQVQPREGAAAPIVVIAFGREHTRRVRYVQQVLGGSREASARSHRRIAVDLDVRWRVGQAQYASRLRDISLGGAFIVSRFVPPVDSVIEIELRSGGAGEPFRCEAVVSWVRNEGSELGFGVNFKLPDRSSAARLAEVVREHERRSR